MILRAQVRAFAEAMERRLQANDWKGGWTGCDAYAFCHRILDEYCELLVALDAPQANKRVLEEAADVANFAMIVCDLRGALPAPREEAKEDA